MAEQNNNNDAAAGGPPAPPPPPGPGDLPVVRPGQARPPGRRGLPGWAWALIAGGAAITIAVIVVVALVATSLLGALSSGNQAGEEPVAPANPTAPAAGESATPAPAAGASGTVVTLEEHADLGASLPVWLYPVQAGWETLAAEEDGVSRFTNAQTGCLLSTSQHTESPDDPEATGDMTDSLTKIEHIEQGLLDGRTGAELIGELDRTEFSASTPAGQGNLEFILSRIDYLDDAVNLSYTHEIALRAVPLSEAILMVVLTCPTTVVDAGDSPFGELRADLTVSAR